MSIELDIPDEAFERAASALSGYMAESDAYDAGSDALRAGTALAVAAELERIAKGRSMIAPEELQDRAAELRKAAER